jgi:hypothetical protein
LVPGPDAGADLFFPLVQADPQFKQFVSVGMGFGPDNLGDPELYFTEIGITAEFYRLGFLWVVVNARDKPGFYVTHRRSFL